MTTATTTPAATPLPGHAPTRLLAAAAAPFGRRTWLRSLHLLADLPIGSAAFTLAATAVSTSAGLALTLVGVPLLVLTLAGARWYAGFERARTRALLGVDLGPARPARRGLTPRHWLRELRDGAGWKALLHALVLMPLGALNGAVVLAGWLAAGGLVVAPVAAALRHDGSHLGSLPLASPLGALVAVLAGLAVAAVMPPLVRLLAALDAALGQALLAAPSPRG